MLAFGFAMTPRYMDRLNLESPVIMDAVGVAKRTRVVYVATDDQAAVRHEVRPRSSSILQGIALLPF